MKTIRRDNCGIDTLKVNNVDICSSQGKAEALSQQYSNVFTTEDLANIPEIEGDPFPTIDDLKIDNEGVRKLLDDINPKKASGPDGVSSHILKELCHELAPMISHIFSQSLESGEIPSDWLNANITAIYKKGPKNNPANYRPVSLTSVTCKLMEHVIFRHIMCHLEKYNLLSHFQHGFRSNHSCESQLIITIENLARNIDSGLQTDLLILDFQKAFDTVPHQRLLKKLNHYGIRGSIWKWIQNWLTNRTQKVVVDGVSAQPVPVLSGVPQGTVLGPLMFLIYINDIASHISNTTFIRLFADDCLLYRVIKTSDDNEVLQNDLTSLYNWSRKWQMSFNASKCKTLRVTTKRKPIVYTYSMGNEDLECVSHHPYLGVEITHNLKWSMHINNIVAKANRALWFIRRNLHRCSKSIKEQMYTALVRPHLEYACAVWDPNITSDIQKIEMVQRRAARFVVGNYKRSEGTVTGILNELKWATLQERRKNIRLATMYKIQTQDIAIPVPDYIQRPSATTTRQYHPLKFRLVKTSTNVYKYSFFPNTISEWNILPPSILESRSIEIFKTGLNNM